LAFSSAIPAYTNSSFLESITNEKMVGIIYSFGSILSLLALVSIPKFLRRYGNYKVTFFFTIAYFLDLLGLAFLHNIFFVLFCFIITGAISTVIYFNLDVFVEHNSTDIETGRIRSVYLTCMNFAWLLSPFLAGIIVGESSYKNIYFVVALIIIPIIFIVSSSLKNFKDPEYKTFNIFESIRGLGEYKNIKNIIFSSFLLQFFILGWWYIFQYI